MWLDVMAALADKQLWLLRVYTYYFWNWVLQLQANEDVESHCDDEDVKGLWILHVSLDLGGWTMVYKAPTRGHVWMLAIQDVT